VLIEDRAQHLLHLLRRPLARERLGGALVRADVQEVGGDAEAIEQALQVHRHRDRPGEQHVAGGRERDAIAGGEQEVARVGRALGVAVELLAGGLPRGERGAQLGEIGQRRADAVDAQEQAGELGVGGQRGRGARSTPGAA
jgi:hypothetical protein